MGEKKNKSLVMKLIDDLIDNEESTTPGKKPKGPDLASTNATATVASTGNTAQTQDLDIADVVKVSESAAEDAPKTAPAIPEKTKATDATMRLNESKIIDPSFKANEKSQVGDLANNNTVKSRVQTVSEAKSAVGRVAPIRTVGFSSATEAALATSENLRIAQNRILELEQELSRLRTENEHLAAAGETLRRRADELLVQTTSLQDRFSRTVENKDQEIELLRQVQKQKEKDAADVKMKVEELEMRLSTNIHKIRVRERELENRLELIKMEGTALVRSKDEMILDLKRQLDQLTLEMENYRSKGQELNKQLGDKQEMLRRTVKALRLALSMLEGEDDAAAQVPQKKVT